MNAVLDAALSYAARGWPVLPLKPGGKAPACQNGANDATTDEATIRDWFRGDRRGVGILTGEQPRLLVVDVDPRNGGQDGLQRMEATHEPLPETLTCQTGGGGWHMFYKLPEGASGFRDRVNVSGFAGVDLKAGGYVVAAPSIHPSGKPYRWQDESQPLAMVPQWLLDLAARTSGGAKAGPISEGGRNDALFKLASSLRG